MNIPKDKRLHFIGGAVISLVLCLVVWLLVLFAGFPDTIAVSGIPLLAPPLAGFLGATVVGIGKEIRDAMGYGTPDFWDAVATSAGGLVASAVFYLILVAAILYLI